MIADLLREVLTFIDTISGRLTDIEDRLAQIEAPTPAPDPVIQPDPVVAPTSAVFSDNFEYPVSRDSQPTGSNTDNDFVRLGGWSLAKATNISGSHLGRLYTVPDSDVPGISVGGRQLAVESITLPGQQSDFYLEKRDIFPAALRISFEICNTGDIHDTKLFYPSPTGSYPVPADSYPVLIAARRNNFGWTGDPALDVAGNPGDLFLLIESNRNTGIRWDKTVGDGHWKMMHTNPVPIPANTRTEVVIDIDLSGTRSAGGIMEARIRPEGGQWTQVIYAEHGTQVLGHNFSWPLPEVRNMRSIRVPTTMEEPGIMYFKNIDFGEIA